MPEATHSKPLAEILLDLRQEIISFAKTRIRLFQAELKETAESMKRCVPWAATAAVLLGSAYLLLTAAIVSLVALLFAGNRFRWPIAFSLVAAAQVLLGSLALAKARLALGRRGAFPTRTVEILRADGAWLKDEVKRAS